MATMFIIKAKWYGAVPVKNDKPLPPNQWARHGRKRRWFIRWYSPDGKRPRRTFETKEEAEEFVARMTADVEKYGEHARIVPKRITLGEFIDEVIRNRTGPRGEEFRAEGLQPRHPGAGSRQGLRGGKRL